MQTFELSLGQAARSTGFGTSVSEGDQLRISVLDSREQDKARLLLDHHLQSDQLPDAALVPGVGYVIENLHTGVSRVVAAPIGLRQIFWHTPDGGLQISSKPSGLRTASGGSAELQPDALFRYIYFHYMPGPATVFADVKKLDAGHVLEWKDGVARVSRYWYPSFVADPDLSLDGAADELQRLLSGAVDRAMTGASACGTFLSGGLDSSSVAGMAARLRPGIPTVSMGFDAAGYDEMVYARIASKHFGTKPLEYYVTPEDVLRTLPDIAAAFAEPFGNSSAAAAFHCARIARENGLDTLLAGDGGDEIFGGNDRYAMQLVFERYTRTPGLLRALLEPVVTAAAAVTTRFPVGKAQSYIRQAKIPLPDRLQEYNFLHRIAPEEVFNADLLRHVDREAPLRQLRDEYSVPTDADAVNRMLFLDWKFTLHDNDLVKVNTMCDLAGIRVTYPMLDPALVDFSMRLPTSWKVRGSELRWFYKRALRNFLPHDIINKTKHGFGLPFGAWTRTHAGLQRLAADALQSLSKRRYFRPEFIAEAQRLHREGHASYYGELVWILLVLELWLQRHMPRAGL